MLKKQLPGSLIWQWGDSAVRGPDWGALQLELESRSEIVRLAKEEELHKKIEKTKKMKNSNKE